MNVLEVWECLSWMGWVSWRVWWLDRGVSHIPKQMMISGIMALISDRMVFVELWVVQNSNPFRLVIIHLVTIIHLSWTIFLLFRSSIFRVNTVSFRLHHSHWLVWLIDWFEFTDLPQLQSVNLGGETFYWCQSVVFESNWMNGLMIQIYQNYNPFNLIILLFVVMSVMIERRLAMNPTTSRTHWQWEVGLNEMMNE